MSASLPSLSLAHHARTGRPMRRHPRQLRAALILPLCAVVLATSAQAGDHQGWKTVGDVGVAALLATSIGVAPAVHDDWQGFREAIYSNGIAGGVGLLGKAVIHEERPNHADHHSFPSNHTAFAFASATTLEMRYGWQWGLPAYAGAALIGVSRVAAREHHWWDVAAGAGLGIASGWLVTHPYDKQVVLLPWIGHKSGGVILAARW